eukprot:NODE_254_length_2201_cov_129.512054_g248_i0.p1 GENE.NODE_254_length_2201_cov_129.512054_g248_i0~~NODE_254_length_2201_cov_129.512054_g248_i0.p1  ORF type:complete len:472 (+),score=120.37 NODE_254_length_2201_cov_129.512054_g248_i0:61-1476(+)
MSQSVTLKLQHRGVTRKVKQPIEHSFDLFKDSVKSVLGLTPDANISVEYTDEDGDWVLIDSDLCLAQAWSEAEKQLVLRIVDVEEEAANKVSQELEEYKRLLEHKTKFHFGYPYNLHYDHEEIYDLMRYSINNLGDPFVESNYGVHSRKFELAVLAFFAKLWKIKEGDYWGYVTCSGTEGNLHSILTARENLPDGVLYASNDSHYSVFKAAKFYRMPAVRVNSDSNGEICYDHFTESLRQNLDKPAIVVANIGTTVKGAVDKVHKIVEILQANGYNQDRFYIHCDGALYALMLPFMTEFPQVNFELPINSMCVSGHKFLGCPMPCGVTVCRKHLLEAVSRPVEYLNSVDTTIMGSRNGHAPIFLWYTLQKGGLAALEKKVRVCHANAALLHTLLTQAGIKAMLNESSTTVLLARPPDAFVKKWQLACEKEYAHVVVMPNVTTEKIVIFVEELSRTLKSNAAAEAEPVHNGH